jgi:hypothetical protein
MDCMFELFLAIAVINLIKCGVNYRNIPITFERPAELHRPSFPPH